MGKLKLIKYIYTTYLFNQILRIPLKTTINNSKIVAQFNTKGAELCSLKNKLNNREYIWEGSADFWGKHSPVLFPIVGTLRNNTYNYNNKEYNLSRHGFARDCDFKIVYQQENEVVFSLEYDDATLKIYPFQFELQLKYSLTETTLTIGYTIINKDKVAIPFSIGAHPAFALPTNFENYSLQFQEQETLKCYVLENDLVSDKNFNIHLDTKKLPLSYTTFENDALIFKSLKSKEITIVENQKEILKVSFSDFENLGIWTKVNAPFICIEPWLGYSDTINSNGKIEEKDGIQIVKENEQFECSFTIAIL